MAFSKIVVMMEREVGGGGEGSSIHQDVLNSHYAKAGPGWWDNYNQVNKASPTINNVKMSCCTFVFFNEITKVRTHVFCDM